MAVNWQSSEQVLQQREQLPSRNVTPMKFFVTVLGYFFLINSHVGSWKLRVL